ncbi:invasion associated locus B family protein [Ensifer sp.]|uniref:invasion associated locus B family protein n=1 Tax=Ensifer sp. TaxID=1872086 RepID=UPI00289FBCC0|nr:invasion associated locus B family protein [Ensifer sp.]
MVGTRARRPTCPRKGPGPFARWAIGAALSTLSFGLADRSNAQDATPSALSETYQDWVVECTTARSADKAAQKQAGRKVCQISQSLLQANSHERVLTIAFAIPSGGKDGLSGTIVAPFGLDLQSGIRLRIEKDMLLTTTFKTCLPQGCLAAFAPDEKLERALRAGAKLVIEMTAADSGQRVDVAVSLKGFSQSLDRLKKLSANAEMSDGAQ